MSYDYKKEDEKKRKKKQQSMMEAFFLQMMEKSLKTTMDTVMQELFKDWK